VRFWAPIVELVSDERDFPQAERHYAQALTIPLFPGMTDAQVTHVSEVVTEVLS